MKEFDFGGNRGFSHSAEAIRSAGAINAGSSVLYLFTPRNIIPHFKRPLMYNFDNEVLASIGDGIVNKPLMDNSVQSIMNTNRSINSAIVPVSQGGFGLATNKYSDYWMFVLIVDDDHSKTFVTASKFTTRTIMIGICSDIPITQLGMSSATPEKYVNPNCQLIITKQFQTVKTITANATGMGQRTRAGFDENIVHYDKDVWESQTTPGVLAGYLRNSPPPPSADSRSFFTMMPGDLGRVTTSDGDTTSSIIDYGNSINVRGASTVSSVLESPRRHMKEILIAVETGVSNDTFGETINRFEGEYPTHDSRDLNIEQYIKSALDQSSQVHTSTTPLHGITAPIITIGMVMSKYYPKVQTVTTPLNTPAEIIPQNVSCINNVFSSLTCALIPTYLNTIGLSYIAFMYNSEHDAFKIIDVQSIMVQTQQELRFRVAAFIKILRTELFPVLYDNGGPFDLQVGCNLNGTTDVVLNFFDHALLPTGVIYQENTVLGGIVSPLVGNADNVRANSNQLNNLVRTVSSMAGATYDQKAYPSDTNSYPVPANKIYKF